MVQCGERLGLASKPYQSVRISRKEVGQHFEGDVTIELGIAGAIHLAHPAGPKGREDFIGAEAGADREGQMLARVLARIIRGRNCRRPDYSCEADKG